MRTTISTLILGTIIVALVYGAWPIASVAVLSGLLKAGVLR